MLTVVTGAAGFVGRSLAARMAQTAYPGAIRLVDELLPHAPSGRFEAVIADLADRAAMASALAGADVVVHLAALPGGTAQADPAASRRINLDASLDLIDLLGARATAVRLVYASSIAVLGAVLPESVDDTTSPQPAMTYGAHKLMVEVAVADAARRGAVNGIALRLPGIVARPPTANGLKSAFMSDVFDAIRSQRPITLPVGPDATMWMISARACADALIHGARIAAEALPAAAVTLPALRIGMAQLVAAIAAATERDAAGVRYRPDPAIEAQFGRLPPLSTPAADALGFVHDGDLPTLVERALAGTAALEAAAGPE